MEEPGRGVITELQKMARPCTTLQKVAHVAPIGPNNDRSISELGWSRACRATDASSRPGGRRRKPAAQRTAGSLMPAQIAAICVGPIGRAVQTVSVQAFSSRSMGSMRDNCLISTASVASEAS